MSYNWKCCSFYPNNFDASALPMQKGETPKTAWEISKADSFFVLVFP